jgi:hypothetical protein
MKWQKVKENLKEILFAVWFVFSLVICGWAADQIESPANGMLFVPMILLAVMYVREVFE